MKSTNHRIDEILTLIAQAVPDRAVFESQAEVSYDYPVVDLHNISEENARTAEEASHSLSNASRELATDFPGIQELAVDDRQRDQAVMLLQRLKVNRLAGIRYGLDFALELRHVDSLARADRNSAIFFALISIAGDNARLARENHGSGYHFHYVSMLANQNARTNALFTFDSTEKIGSRDTLYWERHGNYSSVNPATWGKRRRRAIHSAALPSIHNPGKANFRMPSNDAKVLWPQ